jgi:hypothetical protein
MTLEQFTRFIEALKTFYSQEEKFGNAFELFNSSWTVIEFCPQITEAIITYLEEYFNDKDAWINYWLYDLDFGNKSAEAKYADGSLIPLETIENLFNFLNKNKVK